MNGIHDMGGMHGFGPVVRDEHAPAAWEELVEAIDELLQRQGIFNLDEFRYGIEQMPPLHYLRASYFERWLATVEYNLVQKGILTGDEVDARQELLRRQPDAELPRPAGTGAPGRAVATPPPAPPPVAPRFAAGDAIVTRNTHPRHHTRIPRYARGKHGVIHLVHGPEVFPDTNAHGLGDQPQVVYSVRFDGRELWGESAEPRQVVYIDLWESYLEPAPI